MIYLVKMFRICSECSEFSVMFRLCLEFLAQKLACSEFLDFVVCMLQIKYQQFMLSQEFLKIICPVGPDHQIL